MNYFTTFSTAYFGYFLKIKFHRSSIILKLALIVARMTEIKFRVTMLIKP